MSEFKTGSKGCMAVMAVALLAIASCAIMMETDESDAATNTLDALTMSGNYYPSSNETIVISNVSSVTTCKLPYVLNGNIMTINVGETCPEDYSVTVRVTNTSGKSAIMFLCPSEKYPIGAIDEGYAQIKTYYAAVGTTVKFDSHYNETDEESFYLDYLKAKSVTSGYGLSITSDGSVTGTITKAGTISIVWLECYGFCEEDPDLEGEHEYTTTIQVISTKVYHTVTYDANGGAGTMANTVVTDTNNGNSDVTLAGNSFTKSGLVFAGWKVGNTTYKAGQTVSVGPNVTVTAVAQWVPVLGFSSLPSAGVIAYAG